MNTKDANLTTEDLPTLVKDLLQELSEPSVKPRNVASALQAIVEDDGLPERFSLMGLELLAAAQSQRKLRAFSSDDVVKEIKAFAVALAGAGTPPRQSYSSLRVHWFPHLLIVSSCSDALDA